MKIINKVFILLIILLGLAGFSWWMLYRHKESPTYLTTQLFRAIREGNAEMVELLLSKGDTTDLEIKEGPLDESVNIALRYHERISSAPRIPWTEVQKNQKKIIPLLMNVNAPTKYPEIVLAVIQGNFDRIKELFEKKKVDISKLSKNPIDLARALMFADDKQITDYVIKRIPEVEVTMKEERYPIFRRSSRTK